MPRRIITDEQADFLIKGLETKAPWQVLEDFHKEFPDTPYTSQQFKSFRSNRGCYGHVFINPYKGTSAVFNTEEEAFIKSHYQENDSICLAILMEREFHKKYDPKQIRCYKHNRGMYTKLTGAYSELRPHPHKGEKGWCLPNSEATRFKKVTPETDPFPIGSVVLRPVTKRKLIKVEQEKWIFYHRYLWEQANGPLKKGELITFKNGDTTDCRLENLMVINAAVRAKWEHKVKEFEEPIVGDLKEGVILLCKLELAIKAKENK